MSIESKIADPKFDEMLETLRTREFDYIEYGDPVMRHFSYCRIRYIATHGGMQFAIKLLNSLGQEGSGSYYQDQPQSLLEMKLYLSKWISHYERPQPHIERMRKRLNINLTRSNLRFFSAKDTPHDQHLHA